VLGARKHPHVGADLGDDVLGSATLDRGDRVQQLNGGLERSKAILDRVREAVDLLIEEVHWTRMAPISNACSSSKRVQRLPQRRVLHSQPALG